LTLTVEGKQKAGKAEKEAENGEKGTEMGNGDGSIK